VNKKFDNLHTLSVIDLSKKSEEPLAALYLFQ